MILSDTEIKNLLQSSTSLSDGRYEVRIALDVGSGSTKVKGVLFDTFWESVEDDFGNMNVPIAYQKYISESAGGHTLPDEGMIFGISKLFEIIDHFKDFGFETIKCVGIATAWARNAYNSSDYLGLLEKFGIHIKTISQEEEGVIGYKVAESKLKDIDEDGELIVLDIGGGSFQLSHEDTLNLEVFNGPYGASNFFKEVRDHVGNYTTFLSEAEVEKAREYSNEHVKSKIKLHSVDASDVKKVGGIGQFLNIGIKSLVNKESITLEEIKGFIYSFTSMTVFQASNMYPEVGANFMLAEHTNLILLESIMEAQNINEIHFVDAKSVDYVIDTQDLWSGVEALNYEAFSELVEHLCYHNQAACAA